MLVWIELDGCSLKKKLFDDAKMDVFRYFMQDEKNAGFTEFLKSTKMLIPLAPSEKSYSLLARLTLRMYFFKERVFGGKQLIRAKEIKEGVFSLVVDCGLSQDDRKHKLSYLINSGKMENVIEGLETFPTRVAMVWDGDEDTRKLVRELAAELATKAPEYRLFDDPGEKDIMIYRGMKVSRANEA